MTKTMIINNIGNSSSHSFTDFIIFCIIFFVCIILIGFFIGDENKGDK